MRPVLRLLVVLAGTVVIHLTVLSRLRIDGVRPDALLLLAVMAGVVAGPDRGAVIGFVAGVLADLFLQTPLGLSALVYCLVAFAVGSLQAGVLRASWWIPVLTAFAASAGGVVLYALLAAVVGRPEAVSPRLSVIAVGVGLMNAVLAPVVQRLLAWALSSHGRAVVA